MRVRRKRRRREYLRAKDDGKFTGAIGIEVDGRLIILNILKEEGRRLGWLRSGGKGARRRMVRKRRTRRRTMKGGEGG